MSKQLLYHLNGCKTGHFKNFIDTFNGEPRIAWYPSAGEDFRPLLYLHNSFSELCHATQNEPAPPDVFLFTDYFPWKNSQFLDRIFIYSDSRTDCEVFYYRWALPLAERR